MTEVFFAVFVVTTVLFALAVTTTLGYFAAALQFVQAENRQVDLEAGTVAVTPLVNPVLPDKSITLTKYPPQESYTKPASPGTVIGPSIFC